MALPAVSGPVTPPPNSTTTFLHHIVAFASSWHIKNVLHLLAFRNISHVLVRFVNAALTRPPCLIPGGHYIAYCRNDVNNLWYEFDDQSVTEVSESCVQNAEAYVLFYK